MTNDKAVKRGEIYLYDFGQNVGSVQNGLRPVLVIQADEFNEYSPTTIVSAITTAVKKEYLPSHIYLGDRFGLTKPSMVLLEQTRTINQTDLGEYIGFIDDEHLQKMIRSGIKKTYGFWNYKPEVRKDIHCLCHRCVNDLLEDPDVMVRRLNPFQREKESCDICRNYGYSYAVFRRNKEPRLKR